jgi:hypothetical protein
MSYTFLQAQGEECSAECFSDIPASVQSRLNLTAEKSCCNVSETASCHASQSGMMLERSMACRGRVESTQYAEGCDATGVNGCVIQIPIHRRICILPAIMF